MFNLCMFLFGFGLGYRITIVVLHSWLKEVDEKDRLERIKQLTGYKNE